jgi:Protein of unknown function (DUF4038)
VTFTAAGSIIQSQATTFSLTPAAAGDFILFEVINGANATVSCTGLSSTNVTWTPLTASFPGVNNAYTARIFIGTVTATSAATVTIAWSGTTPGTIFAAGQEFHSTVGAASVTLDTSGHIDTAAGGNAWPSLTPGYGAGELYFGMMADGGTADWANGTPAGFVYQNDADSNGMAYDLSCANAATAGVQTDGGLVFGLAVLVYEAAASAPSSRPASWLPPEMFPPLSRSFGPNAPFYVAEPSPPPPAAVPPPPFVWNSPTRPYKDVTRMIHRDRGEAPTGLPVPVQPPSIPNVGDHRWLRPPLPRRDRPVTALPYVAPTVLPHIAALAGTPGAGWFVDQYANPKLWVASETWALLVRAGEWSAGAGGTWQQDITNFMSQRSAQGVTVCMLDVLCGPNCDGPNASGATWDSVSPFTSGGDPTTGLNSTFWTRVDWLFSQAQLYGISIGFVFNAYDFSTGYAFASWTTTQCQAYGAAVASRYAAFTNLVWLFGNDGYPGSNDTQFSAFLTGIKGTGDTHLVGAWWEAEYTSRYTTDTNVAASWGITYSQFNFTYTYNATYFVMEYAYAETASPDSQAYLLPAIWGDGLFYQGGGTLAYYSPNDRAERQATWWTLADGARGILSEAEGIWPWGSTSPGYALTCWFFVYNLPAICTYFQSLTEWWKLIPDLSSALVTAGRGTKVAGLASGGSGGSYSTFTNAWVAASKTPDGTLAVCYLPNATTITVNTALLASGWTATWVDPINCAVSSAGSGPTFNSTAKGSNSQGDPDWVLVFQAPAAVTPSGIIWHSPRYPQRSLMSFMRRTRVAPTNLLDTGNLNVPDIQQRQVQARRKFSRSGAVASTGWPVPVQPPTVPNFGEHRNLRTPLPRRGIVPESQLGQQTLAVPSTFVPSTVSERTRHWIPRRGGTPSGLPLEQLTVIPTGGTTPRRIWLSRMLRHGQVPTGWPISVQPPELPNYVRRYSRPPWPRRGNVVPTGLPVPVQPPNIPHGLRFVGPRRSFLRKAISETILPQPQQIPEQQRVRQTRTRIFRYGGVVSPTSWPVSVQPPEAAESTKQRFTRILLFRRGNVVPTGWPIPIQPPELSHGLSRSSRRSRQRIGTTITGLPVPVQPPEQMQFVRRWSRPPWPRRGTTENTTPPPVIVNPPISFSERRWSRPPYPRRGVVPPTGLPISVQPQTLPFGLKRWSKPLLPRRGVQRGSTPPPVIVNPPISESQRRWSKPPWFRRGIIAPTGWPVSVQPLERMQSMRRWSRILSLRKGGTVSVPPPPIVPLTPFVPSGQRARKFVRMRPGHTSGGFATPEFSQSTERARIRIPRRFGSSVRGPNAIPEPAPSVERSGRFRKISGPRRVAPGIPPQPPPVPFIPSAEHRRLFFIPFRRGKALPNTGLPVPVQPPERMQFVRRWIKPLFLRRGTSPQVLPPAPVVSTEVILPGFVWIASELPNSTMAIVSTPAYIDVTLPVAGLSITLPIVSIVVTTPLENEEEV